MHSAILVPSVVRAPVTRASSRTLVWLLALALAAGSTPARAETPAADPLFGDDEAAAAAGFPDPFEGWNRGTLRLNLGLDRWLIAPVARAYAFVVPTPARRAVQRAFANLNSPSILANDMLQLEPGAAGVTALRFALNTTVGVAGLFDPAARVGLARHEADFGETLATYGCPSGPYLVLPLAGPTTARDATGYLVDFLFQPTTYVLTPGVQLVYTSITQGSAGIVARDAHAEQLRALEASAADYYAALRNAFYQDRSAFITAAVARSRPMAVARSALGTRPLATAGGEVGDLAAQGGHESLESVALEH